MLDAVSLFQSLIAMRAVLIASCELSLERHRGEDESSSGLRRPSLAFSTWPSCGKAIRHLVPLPRAGPILERRLWRVRLTKSDRAKSTAWLLNPTLHSRRSVTALPIRHPDPSHHIWVTSVWCTSRRPRSRPRSKESSIEVAILDVNSSGARLKCTTCCRGLYCMVAVADAAIVLSLIEITAVKPTATC
jgi:hypothetical protein